MKRKRTKKSSNPLQAGFSHEKPIPIDDMSDEHRQLYFDMSELSVYVKAAYPCGHIMRRIFDRAIARGVDEYGGSLEDLRRAFDVFHQHLPVAEQRRVMNGWSPVPRSERDNLENVLDATGKELSPVLGIHAHEGLAHAFGQTILSEQSYGVEFYVHVGTRKQDVLDKLRSITNFVMLHFDQAIIDPDAANKAAEAANKLAGHDLAGFLESQRGNTSPAKARRK